MKNVYFISDLHLQDTEPKIIDAFLHFLNLQATHSAGLYILGDLFEAWIGDDDRSKLVKHITASLKKLTAQGVPVYFIHGNRDFLIGARFAQETGVTLLADPSVIELYGKKILLMHGDLLCIDDLKYQQFRAKVHQPNFQKRILSLPLFVRRSLAWWARYKSKKHTGKTNLVLQDVNHAEVLRTMTHYDADILIHGHTHRPATHDVTLPHKNAQRRVLAAWHDVGHYLCLTPNGVFTDHSLTLPSPASGRGKADGFANK
jgi:UDP-2,3-diacylglucosamine hydrolase